MGAQHEKSASTPTSLAEKAFRDLARFCAYQERSMKEVRDRLEVYALPTDLCDLLLQRLQSERFLDEQRFAKAFVRGKAHTKGWGRVKIAHHLQQFQLDEEEIRLGLTELDEADYKERLKKILQRKHDTLQELSPKEKYAKLMRYALQKGYEPSLIKPTVIHLIGANKQDENETDPYPL